MNFSRQRPIISALENKKTANKKKFQKRINSFVLDLFCIFFLTQSFVFSFQRFLKLSLGPIAYKASDQISALHSLIFMVTFLGYFIISLYLSDGKTLGKLIYGLKIVPAHNHHRAMTLSECFMRSAGLFLCQVTLFLPFLINIMRKDNKGLPDFFSGTICLSEHEIALIDSLENTGAKHRRPLTFPEDSVSQRISRERNNAA